MYPIIAVFTRRSMPARWISRVRGKFNDSEAAKQLDIITVLAGAIVRVMRVPGSDSGAPSAAVSLCCPRRQVTLARLRLPPPQIAP